MATKLSWQEAREALQVPEATLKHYLTLSLDFEIEDGSIYFSRHALMEWATGLKLENDESERIHFLTFNQVLTNFKINYLVLKRAISNGKIRKIRLPGGNLVYDRRSVEKWLGKGPEGSYTMSLAQVADFLDVQPITVQGYSRLSEPRLPFTFIDNEFWYDKAQVVAWALKNSEDFEDALSSKKLARTSTASATVGAARFSKNRTVLKTVVLKNGDERFIIEDLEALSA